MRILYFAMLLVALTSTAQADQVGDINGNGLVEMTDGILLLKIIVGIPLPADITIHVDADVNGEGKIGMVELIYILQSLAAVPPVALSAQFSDDLSRIMVQFDRDIILPGGAVTSSTGFGSEDTLGQNFFVVASGSKEVTLYLGIGATIALDTLEICAGAVFANGDVPVAATNVLVEAPENPVAPVFAISGPNVIESCGSFQLFAIVNSGTGTFGRPIVYAWSSTDTNLNGILANETQGTVSIAAEALAPDTSYQIDVMVTNFVGQSSSANHNVTVKAAPLPEVTTIGPSTIEINYNDSAIFLSARVNAGFCGEVNQQFSYAWSSTSPGLNQFLQGLSTLFAYIPMEFLFEGFSPQTTDAIHHIELVVSDVSNPSVSVTIGYDVTVLGPGVSANIVGENERTVSTNSNLVIFGEDTNYPTGIPGETLTTYEWTCSNVEGGACVNSTTLESLTMSDYQDGETGASLSIPTNVLGIGAYEFGLTVTNWLGKSSEDSVFIKLVSG